MGGCCDRMNIKHHDSSSDVCSMEEELLGHFSTMRPTSPIVATPKVKKQVTYMLPRGSCPRSVTLPLTDKEKHDFMKLRDKLAPEHDSSSSEYSTIDFNYNRAERKKTFKRMTNLAYAAKMYADDAVYKEYKEKLRREEEEYQEKLRVDEEKEKRFKLDQRYLDWNNNNAKQNIEECAPSTATHEAQTMPEIDESRPFVVESGPFTVTIESRPFIEESRPSKALKSHYVWKSKQYLEKPKPHLVEPRPVIKEARPWSEESRTPAYLVKSKPYLVESRPYIYINNEELQTVVCYPEVKKKKRKTKVKKAFKRQQATMNRLAQPKIREDKVQHMLSFDRQV